MVNWRVGVFFGIKYVELARLEIRSKELWSSLPLTFLLADVWESFEGHQAINSASHDCSIEVK